MRALVIVAFAVLATACGNLPTAPATPPTIHSFSADKLTIGFGESTMLRWQVSGADAQDVSSIGPVSAVDACTIRPPRSTVYTLTARNSAGMSTLSLTVSVATIRPVLPGQ